jgi:chromosome segregation ATPase
MTLTIVVDPNKPCAKCGAMGAVQNGLCLTCISKNIKGQRKGGTMAPREQQHLFGDQDLVINTLETERAVLQEEIKVTLKSIENKKEKLGELESRIENISSSIESIRKAAKAEKPEGKK